MAFVFETKRNCIVDKLLKIIKLIYMKNALCLILDNFDIVGFLIFARIPVDSSHFSLHFNSILSPKNFLKHSSILAYEPTGGGQKKAETPEVLFVGHRIS